jgi:hypothetical protein
MERERPLTKDALLKQVDGLRDLARRAKRLAASMTNEADQRRLARHAEELEESATRIEREAVDAKAAAGSHGGAQVFGDVRPPKV